MRHNFQEQMQSEKNSNRPTNRMFALSESRLSLTKGFTVLET